MKYIIYIEVFVIGVLFGEYLQRRPYSEWMPEYRMCEFIEYKERKLERYVDGSPIYDFRLRAK